MLGKLEAQELLQYKAAFENRKLSVWIKKRERPSVTLDATIGVDYNLLRIGKRFYTKESLLEWLDGVRELYPHLPSITL